MKKYSKVVLLAMLAAVMVFAAACGETEGENGAAHADVQALELVDSSQEELAHVHGDHWDGAPLVIEHQGSLEVYFRFVDGEDEDLGIEPGTGGYEVEIHEEGGSLLGIDRHGDHADLEGLEEGETSLHIELLFDGEVIFEAPEIAVVVGEYSGDEHDHGAGE